MSDERSGRELTPRPEEEPSAVTPREPALPQPSTTAVDRFYAGDVAHTVGLSEERAAQVVRQSSNARMIAFLGALLLVLFIPIYWIYDIGIPALGVSGRMEAEEENQFVADVARGHELYLANCARCHGANGEGGIGPPLNDEAKLYQAITPQGLPGRGHLNPDYIRTVLTVGGRYICGDPQSVMQAWLQPNGPLNYRELEEIIAFITASDEVTWTYAPDHAEPGQTLPPPQDMRGWRDADFSPGPDFTPPPACWRAPAGSPAGGGAATPGAVASPGTPENPRVVEVQGTANVQWVDPATQQRITSIPVVEGETILFRIVNDTPVPHNFHIGAAQELSTAPEQVDLPGVDTFSGSTQEFEYTVENLPEQPQFACTVPGHYSTMSGDLVVVPAGGAPGGQPTDGQPAGSPPPGSPAGPQPPAPPSPAGS